jgi:hypothetical protein
MDAFNELSFEQQIEKEVAGIRNFMDTIMKKTSRKPNILLLMFVLMVD